MAVRRSAAGCTCRLVDLLRELSIACERFLLWAERGLRETKFRCGQRGLSCMLSREVIATDQEAMVAEGSA